MTIVTITEVEPFVGDTFETVRYRDCDFCFATAVDDIHAGRTAEKDWRRFYRLEPDGLDVCEHCLPNVEL